MLGQFVVALGVSDILDQEHHVKPGEDGSLKIHLIRSVREIIVGPESWISRSKHTAASVQHGCHASFGNGDGLLLHGLMDSNTVFLVHLVKLVNANQAIVGQNHCSAFQCKAPTILDNGSSETRSAAALAASVHCNRSHLVRKLQELTLCSSRVAEQKHVDVTSQTIAAGQLFSRPSEKQASYGSFDLIDRVLLACTNCRCD
mmetsp:Transcript_9053/g.21451  ORF Transcript_9053/g.21451 Transcript_9053/m.21451 type:complete len:202 (+) Transcript_9053:764-1369(+)